LISRSFIESLAIRVNFSVKGMMQSLTTRSKSLLRSTAINPICRVPWFGVDVVVAVGRAAVACAQEHQPPTMRSSTSIPTSFEPRKTTRKSSLPAPIAHPLAANRYRLAYNVTYTRVARSRKRLYLTGVHTVGDVIGLARLGHHQPCIYLPHNYPQSTTIKCGRLPCNSSIFFSVLTDLIAGATRCASFSLSLSSYSNWLPYCVHARDPKPVINNEVIPGCSDYAATSCALTKPRFWYVFFFVRLCDIHCPDHRRFQHHRPVD
jgi:hypothetical protein